MFRFEGQLTVFQPYDGPCYRCLYPTPPPPELAPGCSVAGVLGVVPGIMGLLQTNEALKILLGIGEPLIGRLLLFDALDASFTELRLRRDPNCPICSDAAVEARRAGRPPRCRTSVPTSRSPSDRSGCRRFVAGQPGRRQPMSVVRIPPVLRSAAGKNKEVDVEGATVGDVLRSWCARYPACAAQLLTPDGGLNRFVNVYVNGRDVRYLERSWATPVDAATR